MSALQNTKIKLKYASIAEYIVSKFKQIQCKNILSNLLKILTYNMQQNKK